MEISERFATAISGIFVKKVTKLVMDWVFEIGFLRPESMRETQVEPITEGHFQKPDFWKPGLSLVADLEKKL